MLIQRHKGKVERDVCDAWIRLEDGKETKECGDGKQGLSSESERHSTNVTGQMEPENANEEFAKRIEHLDEEIPPKTHIWCQVGYRQMETVSCC